VSGPGTATFGNASDVDTTATFSAIGTYLLKLQATDGQFTVADYVAVVVNPLTATLTAIADTYIDGGSSNTNFGTATSLIADGKPDNGALLKWDLSSIPAGSTIQSVTFSINVTGTSADTFEIYELKRNWVETQATWRKFNSATNWQSAGAQGALDRGTTALGTIVASATGQHNVVLNAAGVAVVQAWRNNPATNFGFTIQDYTNSSDDDLVFSSRSAAVAAQRPQLQIAYVPAAAAQSQSAGMAAPGGGSAGRSSLASALALTTESRGIQTKAKLAPAAQPSSASTKADALLLAAPSSRRLAKAATVDSALASLAERDSGSGQRHGSLSDELLLELAAI
jgi:hypothetical protein